MRLVALSIGEAVPTTPFEGIVHSVFSRACNLLIDDALLTLLAGDLADLPQGIRLHTPSGYSFVQAGLSEGQSAACRAGVLRVANSVLQVDLHGAALWCFDLSTCPVYLCDGAVYNAWRQAVIRMVQHSPREGAGIFGLAPFATALAGLFAAADLLDPDAALGSASSLVGLGPGGTPSGDDFLAGWLVGVRIAAADEPARLAFVDAVAERLRMLHHRTNLVSRTFLEQAGQGRVSSTVAELLLVLGRGVDGAVLENAILRVLQMGHTSGRDTAAGLLSGLAAWQIDYEALAALMAPAFAVPYSE